MEIAEASFEQVPPDGKNAGGHTLQEFAEEAGIEYGTLDQYRQVWRWLDEDFGLTSEISYTVALDGGRPQQSPRARGHVRGDAGEAR
jgi:hypothetical protein